MALLWQCNCTEKFVTVPKNSSELCVDVRFFTYPNVLHAEAHN